MLLTIALLACTTTEQDANTDETLALSEEIVDIETGEVGETEDLSVIEVNDLAETDVELDPVESLIAEDSPLESPVYQVQVRSGENLVIIASWGEVSVEDVLAVNPGLDPSDPLQVGQTLALPGESDEDYVAMRQVWSDARLTRYIDRHGGLAGVVDHRVRTGDTAWKLAEGEAGVPMWVLAAFNEGSDLETLHIGDTVILPVLADQVIAENLVLDPSNAPSLEEDTTAGQ